MTQALYRKWRPRQWDEVVGQQHILQTLRNAITAGRVGHAYLFAGPRGTGKTTIARLLAKAVNCLAENPADRPCNTCEHCKAVNETRFLDLIEIDAASNTSVDDVRDLRDKINFSPSQGKYKIYIIDEVHMLSTAAFNALLKTLEEPPPHAIFVLATTEIHKIPATVLSRCQRHEFRRVPVDEVVAQLKQIVKDEKIKANDDALVLIARQGTGSLRDSISLLDQLASTGEKITLALAQTVLGTATSQTVLDLVESVRANEPSSGLEAIHKSLDAGSDARALARQIVDYLRAVLLIQMGNPDQVETTAEVKKSMQAHARAFSTADVLRMMKSFNTAATDLRGGWQPALNLELAFAESLERAGEPPAPASVAKPAAASRRPPEAEPAAPGPDPAKITGSAPSSVPEPAPAPIIGAGQVIKSWKQIASSVKGKSPNLAALLNSVTSIDVQGDVLVLGFASDVLREKMDKSDQAELARQAVREALGVDLQIRCLVTHAKGQVPPNVAEDGMVAAAIQQGGEIVQQE